MQKALKHYFVDVHCQAEIPVSRVCKLLSNED